MSQPPSKVIHLPKIRMLRGGRAGGIRITNVKTVRPPDPETAKQQEESKLRAQLQKEIVSRSRACANKSYECHLPVLSGRQFCAQHILQDPSAPYRQCVYTSGSGVRCSQPAPADSREQRDMGVCYTHARAALRARARAAAPPPPAASSETLLQQLAHYVRPERPRTTSCASSVSVVSDPAEPETVAPDPVDPFKQIDATAVNAAYSASIMECASASDSDADSVTLGPGGSCRATRPPSDHEDAPCERAPLWRAGVFTAEEAVSEARRTLCALQTAYIKQMGRLHVLLRAARLKYLRQLKAEREQYCSINSQARGAPTTARERRQLRKLKAYASYHRRHGVDAVLARKLHRKRAKVKELHARAAPAHARCTHADGGARCPRGSVPAARHCLRHIAADRHQVLFTECGDARGLSPCREPVPRLPLPSAACRHHTMPPAYTVFTLKKDDSDSDESHAASEASHVEEQR